MMITVQVRDLERVIAAALEAGAVYVAEFGRPLDIRSQDWSQRAWQRTVTRLGLTPSQDRRLWPAWEAVLIVRACAGVEDAAVLAAAGEERP